eukprot:COSAG01_NODE_6914_length_3434_cov_49.052065_2_plen_238_part_00
MLATTLTPMLAALFGWRAVARTFGACVAVFCAAWQLWMRDTPPVALRRRWQLLQGQGHKQHNSRNAPPQSCESSVAVEAAGTTQQQAVAARQAAAATSTFEPRIFGLRSVQVVMLMHFNANYSEITLLQWAPSYLVDQLGVPLAQLGRYLLAPAVVEQCANVCGITDTTLPLPAGPGPRGAAAARSCHAMPCHASTGGLAVSSMIDPPGRWGGRQTLLTVWRGGVWGAPDMPASRYD